MDAHETREIEQLSDERRALLLPIGDGECWVYRQPGGCFEIGQHPMNGMQAVLIHICETADWDTLIAGMQAVRDRVPQRF